MKIEIRGNGREIINELGKRERERYRAEMRERRKCEREECFPTHHNHCIVAARLQKTFLNRFYLISLLFLFVPETIPLIVLEVLSTFFIFYF